jgi:hypothetical protein
MVSTAGCSPVHLNHTKIRRRPIHGVQSTAGCSPVHLNHTKIRRRPIHGVQSTAGCSPVHLNQKKNKAQTDSLCPLPDAVPFI